MKRRAFWTPQRLKEFQNEKVRKIIKYADVNSRFYHRKFRQAGIRPDDVKTIEDLNKVPIVRKEELVKNLQEVVSKEFEVENLRSQRTSGSTGRPLYIYITQAEDEFRKAKHLRANIACGQKPWHKWVTITSPLHFAETPKLQRLIGLYAVTPLSVFDDVATQVSKIERLSPDILDGYSNSILLLAKEVEKRGLKTIKPKFLITGAELIAKSSQEFIEDVFDASLYDQYASVELERMAWQCREKSEYHIDADSVVMQFVDEDGEEVAPGERGEIVCTSLFNYAMPIIRYALGDVGIPSKETHNQCGIRFPLMKVLEGRKESIVVLPKGRSLSPLAIGDCICAFKYFTNIYQYRFIQKKTDLFKILIKKKDGSVEDEIMKAELLAHIRKTLNLNESDAVIEMEFVEEIPPDKTGKIRKVVSEIRNRRTI